jgi:hypothetical protein
MAKFGKNAKPAFKKAVLKDQYERLTATKDRTLKQVREDYVANMWPEDRKILFPKSKTKEG